MAQASTLYRFKLSVSDIDRGFYESLDLRVAMHPSETEAYLLTRVIAYALNAEDGLEFSTGLSTPDEPAIRLTGEHGQIAKWIDIGNPAARRLHKASKAAGSVLVYTYKDPQHLIRDAAGETVHRSESIEIHALDPAFLKALGLKLKRDNSWSLIHNGGELVIAIGQAGEAAEESLMSTITRHRLVP